MSQQIIEVLEYFGDKLGVAIDWTTENIMPYIEQLFKRYVTMQIVTSSVLIAIGAMLCIASIVICNILIKQKMKIDKDKINILFWERGYSSIEPTFFGVWVIVLTIGLCIAGVVLIFCNIMSLLQWIIIPEVPFVREITTLINTI